MAYPDKEPGYCITVFTKVPTYFLNDTVKYLRLSWELILKSLNIFIN